METQEGIVANDAICPGRPGAIDPHRQKDLVMAISKGIRFSGWGMADSAWIERLRINREKVRCFFMTKPLLRLSDFPNPVDGYYADGLPFAYASEKVMRIESKKPSCGTISFCLGRI